MTSSSRGAKISKHWLQQLAILPYRKYLPMEQKVSSNGTEGTKASLLGWQYMDFMNSEKKKEKKKKNCAHSSLQYFYPIVLECQTPFFPCTKSARLSVAWCRYRPRGHWIQKIQLEVNNCTSLVSMGGRKKEAQTYPVLLFFFKAFIDFSLHSSFNQLSVKNEECIFNLYKNVLLRPKVLSDTIKHFCPQLCIHFLRWL